MTHTIKRLKAKGNDTAVFDSERKCWKVRVEEYNELLTGMREFVEGYTAAKIEL